MNKILAFAVKFSGFGWIWDKINGFKAKIGAIGLMLGGVIVMLTGVVQIINAWTACADFACIIGIVRNFSTNPAVPLIAKGFGEFMLGLSTLGIGHKLEKAAAISMPVGPEMPKLCDVELPEEPPKPV